MSARGYWRYAGVVACVAVLPLAAVASRMRLVTAMTIVADTLAKAVRLPDGSVAQLSAGSTMRYRRNLVGGRRVWLFGQATFLIVPGSTFAVWTETAVARTPGAILHMLAFNRESTFVFVQRGSVRLRALNEDNDAAYPTAI